MASFHSGIHIMDKEDIAEKLSRITFKLQTKNPTKPVYIIEEDISPFTTVLLHDFMRCPEIAQAISERLSVPCLYAEHTESEYFIIMLFSNGKKVTEAIHVSDELYSTFLDETVMDVARFSEELYLTDQQTQEFTKALSLDYPSDAMGAISDILLAPLFIDYNEFMEGRRSDFDVIELSLKIEHIPSSMEETDQAFKYIEVILNYGPMDTIYLPAEEELILQKQQQYQKWEDFDVFEHTPCHPSVFKKLGCTFEDIFLDEWVDCIELPLSDMNEFAKIVTSMSEDLFEQYLKRLLDVKNDRVLTMADIRDGAALIKKESH